MYRLNVVLSAGFEQYLMAYPLHWNSHNNLAMVYVQLIENELALLHYK
jgi:hypothetical protein